VIIRSIRLKNIKSYGSGPEGDGVTVSFDVGINRVAGRNGNGKSTLIESLGYSLFLASPVFEEKFEAAKYLLRAGEKSGEIDVTFEHDGDTYRVERGVGARNHRRSKVVQASDGSIAAEGDQEVSEFLCRLLGFPAPDRLTELFSKLIGVKQGRLPWPFDSKGADAKRHFEPLLDVEIFRDCFDQLKPVVDDFNSAVQIETTKLSAVEERLRERQDAPKRAKARRIEVGELENTLTAARTAVKQAEETKVRWEAIEKTWIDLRALADKAAHDAGLAAERRSHAEQRLRESTEAASAVNQTAADHAAYCEAEKSLITLQEKQRERAKLEAARSQADARRIEADEKAAAAKAFADDCAGRRDLREKQAAKLKQEAQARRTSLDDGKSQFDKDATAVQQARKDDETLRHWINGLREKLAAFEKSVAAITQMSDAVKAWSPGQLKAARDKEQSAAKHLEQLSGQLTAMTELHEALKIQLAEIAGGLCPFLKEPCRQFDPAKVSVDAQAKEADVARLKKQVASARESYQTSKTEADRLHAAETKVAATRETLTARLEELRHENDRLLPANIAEASARLGIFAARESIALDAPSDPTTTESVASWLKQTRNLQTSAQSWFQALAPSLIEKFESSDRARDRRIREEHELKSLEKEQDESRRDIEALTKTLTDKLKEKHDLRAKAEAESRAVTGLADQLKAFASLDDQVAEQQRRKSHHAAGHQRHLAARPIADALSERRRQADELKVAEANAARIAEESKVRFNAAAQAIDSAALEASRKANYERAKECSVAEERLQQAKRELERDEQRLREYELALTERNAIRSELARLDAAIALTEKARAILKNAAPHVAQHLCRRIAARAQQIFNNINHEPAELEWNSERYSLRIHPGDRRFAMLSGGEQTKLALAMTLAMIQEFSGLKFCVFDEPTYGVDGDSRIKLADAILAAQDAAGFDQLILVSHDDVFDGRIEHTVRLTKTAAGTHPVTE
jgi:exonuclease SbcC